MCTGERRKQERTTLGRTTCIGKHLVRVNKNQGHKVMYELKENREGNKDKERKFTRERPFACKCLYDTSILLQYSMEHQ